MHFPFAGTVVDIFTPHFDLDRWIVAYLTRAVFDLVISANYRTHLPSQSRIIASPMAISRLPSLTIILLALLFQHGKALPRASDFLVQGLEDIEPAYGLFPGDMYAGTLPMDNGDRYGSLMFWMFAPDAPSVNDAMVIWLNGGPGCTSINAGLLFENSPVTTPLRPAGFCCSTKDDPLVYNKYSWTNASAIMYVEQPVSVGFSQGGPLPQNEEDFAGDFHVFYQNFLKVFPQYQSYRVFIVGESYAGMYAPAIARRMYWETKNLTANNKINKNNYNDHNKHVFLPINLAGVALGNGWMDARVQGPVVIDYAYWHGLIDAYTKDALHQEFDRCMAAYDKHKVEKEQTPFHRFTIPDECSVMSAVLEAAGKGLLPDNPGGPLTYDVTTWDTYQSLQHGDNIDQTNGRFMNNPKVKKLLHAPKNVTWHGCLPGAGRRRRRRLTASASDDKSLLPGATLLAHDQPESTVPYVAELLDAGIPVLVYNGDRDLSTCAQGSEMLLNSMSWSGAEGWRTTPRGLWVAPNGQVAGYAKSHKGLGFVVVYNSGHMVPTNQPVAGLDLITRFMSNQSFLDYELPSFDRPQSMKAVAKINTGGLSSVTWIVFATALLAAFGAGFLMSSRRKNDYRPIGDAAVS
jgi:carboxypeptidase C (cathepsin A)